MDGAATDRGSTDLADLLERAQWHGAPVSWDEIVGHEPAKRELRVVAEQIRRHSVAERLGLTTVKGVLLSGPPGSGKTLLAKALATAIDRAAYVIPAGEVDARLIRRVYEALAGQSSVVIWDEADVILRGRWGRSAPEEGRTVAAFCAALDGVDAIHGPITVALTAEGEHVLDPAAIRAGRLTTKIELALPRLAERRILWERSVGLVPVEGVIDLDRAADRSTGMSGADIAASVMVAMGLSMVDGTDTLTPELLDEVLIRRHHVVERPRSGQDLRRTAVHEAGHAIYATLVWGSGSVATITITGGRDDLGRTELADSLNDRCEWDRRRLREYVGMRYAGLVAEEVIYGDDGVTVGCMQDIEQATGHLRELFAELGADSAIGPIALSQIERGTDSDRGTAEMRSALWSAVRIEAERTIESVRRALVPRQAGIAALADALLAAPDGTLSGTLLESTLAIAIQAHAGDADDLDPARTADLP